MSPSRKSKAEASAPNRGSFDATRYPYASLVILHPYNYASNGLVASKHIITNQKHIIVFVNIIVRNIQFNIDHLTLNEGAQLYRSFFWCVSFSRSSPLVLLTSSRSMFSPVDPSVNRLATAQLKDTDVRT